MPPPPPRPTPFPYTTLFRSLSTKGPPPMSSDNPQRLPLPPAQLRAVSTPRNVPCPTCPAPLHHQQLNAGTRHDLPDICSVQTRRSEEHTSELQSQSNLVCRL